VAGVLADVETCALPDREKVLFRFLRKVNEGADGIERAEVDLVRAADWSDEAIYDAVTVCALFNFYNRWCDATGVREMPAEAFEASGQRLAAGGYVPPGPGGAR
jgi:alkylhydroperoxidase family enzyme